MINKAVLLLIIIPTVLLSQQIGWEEVYKDFGDYFTLMSVYRTSDDGFIGTAVKSNKNVLFKINSAGSLEQSVLFDPTISTLCKPLTKTTDGNFLLAFRDSTGINLVKLNEDLQTIWTNIYPLAGYKFRSVNQTNSGNYLVTVDGSNDIRLLKFTDTGDFISDTTFNISSPYLSSYFIPLTKFPDGTFLFGGYQEIVKLNQNGEYLWSKYIGNLHSAAATSNNEILIGTDSSIIKLDNLGNPIWSDQTLHVYSIISKSDGTIVFSQGSYNKPVILNCKDTNGNDLWERKLNGNCFNFLQNPDESLVLSGNIYFSYSYYLAWTALTNPEGIIKSVTLLNPGGEEILPAGETYSITWLSNQVEYVNIEISSDAGVTWNTIINNYPDSVRRYDWEVPGEYVSTNCLMKITSSSEPVINDITDSTFTITHYQEYDYIAANEIKMWIGNNGDGSHNPSTDAQGLFWPGGEEATQGAVFEDGLVFAGKVNGEIRAGGSTYRHGLRPGNVLSDLTAADPEDLRFQVWKIKKETAGLSNSEKLKYEYNYDNWPVDLGAPWVDKNLDGVYTPGIDHPKYYGEETLFNVMNDLDTAATKFLYGSNPMGLEIQCLTYGIDTTNGLKDAVFKQYKLINKSSNEITDMYLAYWCDNDLGDANDDYTGVDTTLNMGYDWNGKNDDWIYGSPPPALGHMIIQGPIVTSSESDSARFDNGWRHGYKNLPATAFVFYIGSSSVYMDPWLGSYNGTLHMYNNMQGLTGLDGSSYIDPNTGESTVFCLSGDPVAGTGWYEGDGWPGGPWYGDRRYLLSSGPFNLAPGDTQEITIAIFMALGSDNVQSVAALRDKAAFIQEFYNNDLLREINPLITPIDNFRLEQNYPNPFNSITNIEYTLPVKSRVTIKIYDILGREVKVFNQGEQVPWQYRVSFNASAFASGVYIYRIEAVPVSGQGGHSTGSGQEFIQTKKMVLLK